MAREAASDDYGADKIKVLEGLEAVRKRPAMYIGSTGAPGLHHLVYEVVDNSIDEALAGILRSDQRHDPHRQLRHRRRQRPRHSGRPARERPVGGGSRADGAACRRQVRQRQLQGVRRAARRRRLGRERAVGERSNSRSGANGQVYHQTYERGKPLADLEITGTTKQRGTKVTFKPDSQIFETTEFSFDTLAQRLRELAFLNAGVTITLDDERDGKSHDFEYEGGIVSFVAVPEQEQGVGQRQADLHARREGRHRRRDRAAVERHATPRRFTPSRTTSTRTRAARTCPASARR